MFRKYHYLNTNLHKAAKCFIGIIEKQIVCFVSYLHHPNAFVKNFKRFHRLVVLPDYQGIGIGHKFQSFIAERLIRQGFRPIVTSGSVVLAHSRKKDKRWKLLRQGHSAKHSNTAIRGMQITSSIRRNTMSWEYIGETK